MFGLLCCHALKVYDVMDVKRLPEHYILKRWTREARDGVVQDYMGHEVEEDPKLQSTKRYRKLCLMLIRLAAEASVHPSAFSLVYETMCELNKKVMAIRLTYESEENSNVVKISLAMSSMVSSKGFKKRLGMKRSKRLKGWVELQPKRRNVTNKVKNIGAHNGLHVSCSAPPAPCASLQTIGNQLNFIELLMAHFDHASFERMDFARDVSTANNEDH